MSVEPFNRLVKLAARAFYDDVPTRADNQPKNGRGDNRGMAVVVLDALTRRQWVREEDLAKDLKLHAKQLRRTLRFFEEEKLVSRDHRKETAKAAKVHSAAVAATGDGQHTLKGEEKIKMHTHSYCCLDYAQIYDVMRYRLHRMKKNLKDELENKNTVQEYICPSCQRRYTAFDALQLVSPDDESFRCESCRSELVAEGDKFAYEEMGDVDENARRRRREKLKEMLQKMEVNLKPLMDQLARVKDLPVPEFGSLQAWEARAHAAARAANGNSSANDSSKPSNGQGYGGPQVSYFGDTKVEVALSGVPVKDEDSKLDAGTAAMKIIPPWMIKENMTLTKEQRGDIKELKTDNSSAVANVSDDKKSQLDQKEVKKSIQDEYLKAYYAAILKRQQEQEANKRMQQESADTDNVSNGGSETSSDRRVGMKSKREEIGGHDVEWEEAPTGDSGNTKKHYILHDLNEPAAEADTFGDDEDDIVWEEG